jgi:hypothetical protein
MAIPQYHAFTGELFAGNPAGVCNLPAFLTIAPYRKLWLRTGPTRWLLLFLGADSDFDRRWLTSKVSFQEREPDTYRQTIRSNLLLRRRDFIGASDRYNRSPEVSLYYSIINRF